MAVEVATAAMGETLGVATTTAGPHADVKRRSGRVEKEVEARALSKLPSRHLASDRQHEPKFVSNQHSHKHHLFKDLPHQNSPEDQASILGLRKQALGPRPIKLQVRRQIHNLLYLHRQTNRQMEIAPLTGAIAKQEILPMMVVMMTARAQTLVAAPVAMTTMITIQEMVIAVDKAVQALKTLARGVDGSH